MSTVRFHLPASVAPSVLIFLITVVLVILIIAGPMIGTAAKGSVAADIQPSRTSGVAPLAVFFDASGTTGMATSRPFHDLLYTWDFGDAGSGTWSVTGQDRNSARGPVAGHVFETAGTFTVVLTVRDEAGSQGTDQVTIVVQDADSYFSATDTICISTNADFEGAPAGAKTIAFGSWDDVKSEIATGKRILLRRGHSWEISNNTANVSVQGPGIIGAFGSGPKPVINVVTGHVFTLSGPSTPEFKDWRFMDLEIDGHGVLPSRPFQASGTVKQLLLLRIEAHDVSGGVNLSPSRLDYLNDLGGSPGHTLYDEIAIVETTFQRIVGGAGNNIGYIGAERFMFLGNTWSDSTGGEHVLRTPYVGKGVVSHNHMTHSNTAKHVIKMHAPDWESTGIGYHHYTEQVVIADNTFFSNDGDWTVGLGPHSGGALDQRVRDVIVERNFFDFTGNTQVGLLCWATEVTVRNNIFDTSGGKAHTGIRIDQRAAEPPPTGVLVANNTGYSADVASFRLVSIDAVATNTTVRNNLASAPQSGDAAIVHGGGVNLVASSNLLTNSPGFVVAGPTAPADFRLLAGSPAIDHGMAIPVFDAYDRTSRPQGAAWDAGAYEWAPRARARPTAGRLGHN